LELFKGQRVLPPEYISGVLDNVSITLAASSGKRNVTVWGPSVHLSVQSTYSPWFTSGSMQRGQRIFRPDNMEDRHTCYLRR